MVSHLRVQFSRDLQSSSANSSDVLTRIDQVIDSFGRSTILPRRTREHKNNPRKPSPNRERHFGADPHAGDVL